MKLRSRCELLETLRKQQEELQAALQEEEEEEDEEDEDKHSQVDLVCFLVSVSIQMFSPG